MMQKLGIPQPESGMASTLDEALAIAERIGYPLMVRPSFVLGGRAMEVVHDEAMLKRYVAAAVDVSPERPILIDKFLANAIEVEGRRDRRRRGCVRARRDGAYRVGRRSLGRLGMRAPAGEHSPPGTSRPSASTRPGSRSRWAWWG